MSERRAFTEEEKEQAWNKSKTIPGYDEDKYRQDKVGNIMYHDSYGKNSNMGWSVDHSKPLNEGGTYHPNNLQAMNFAQNCYDKNDQYPYDYSNAEPKGVTRYDNIDTEIDKRCSSYQNNNILLNYDGTVDGRSSAVRSGNVLLTKSGHVDKRCKAAKDGSVTFK
ncbi:hypothetical protein ABK040_011969 [Willaertia magna]